ncbi:uncharacterized protein TRIVIDRAFT_158459 [Trichoderma virens Gv29-8]|uniref:Major facilitator superfamily (MFS) profile domain-containing protein n=1 Tax=Hypocrea virens (strain Gv29-8 / FGSC 10586) TaxID=413071 RepID=G9N4C6_HYPVG|nr:uncharacterized protein TRIVIDRAFT_158459 [Trichoderma virens Gv29-8]EHK18451.1 hypothetical protein TRIVIDRAFT_158459 [Trichoderma virens Gv29-8]UKZ52661.1 hypothetical protein TrVGV298_006442 [Trichoderma virens]
MTSEHTNSVSERTRLLSSVQNDDSNDLGNITHNGNSSDDVSNIDDNISDQIRISRRIAVAVLCLLLLLIVEFAATLLTISISQIEEGVLCRSFYPDVNNPATDLRCKSENVQSELSTIQGWGFTFAIIPGLITAVPYGVAADKYGRRVILSLSILGLLLVEAGVTIICRFPHIFPIRLIWLAALFTLIGGGTFVFNAMIFTIASDVSTEAQRSTVFFYVAAVAIGGKLISGPLAFMAVQHSVWLSVYIGLVCLLACVLLALAFPETRPLSAVETEETRNDDDGRSDTSASSNITKSRGLKMRIYDLLELEKLAILVKYFWENKRLGLLLLSLIFTTLGNYVTIILMQYTTKRFGWTWAKAGLLSSISAFVNLVLLAAILPALSQVLLFKYRLSPVAKDALLARAGMVALTIGAFGIGFSNTTAMLMTTLVIYSLGYGYESSLRSLLIALAGEQHTAMLFAAMSVLQNIGMLIAGPLMAWAFRVGLRWGGAWIGLPFISTGCLLTCATCIVFGVRLTDSTATRRNSRSSLYPD